MATIHDEVGAGDEGGFIGTEEQDERSNVVGLTDPPRRDIVGIEDDAFGQWRLDLLAIPPE